MIKHASQVAMADSEAMPATADSAADEHIAPAPRVSIQAFCETVETAAAVQAAGEDRRLSKAHLKIQMGGIAGRDYNTAPPQGIADAVFSPDRVDSAFVDRLLSKCTDHLSLLAAPATLDRVYDRSEEHTS